MSGSANRDGRVDYETFPEYQEWPQEAHADLGLVDNDRTLDLRPGLWPDES